MILYIGCTGTLDGVIDYYFALDKAPGIEMEWNSFCNRYNPPLTIEETVEKIFREFKKMKLNESFLTSALISSSQAVSTPWGRSRP